MSVVEALLASEEPSVRWKVRTRVLGESADAADIRQLREEIRTSPRVRTLLDGDPEVKRGTYDKWHGRHWVLASLADIGYPEGDPALRPVVDRSLKTWLDARYLRDVDFSLPVADRPATGVPVIKSRHRRCGSQHGSALLSVVRLGYLDERADLLVDRLLHWQWPDGGWNCDKKPRAASSSVYETLLPMRGLAAYAAATGDQSARAAAVRAAEVLLERRLLYGRSTGKLIRTDWARLHYPVYWRYDVVAALKGIAEVGLLDDPRCADALDLLESKRLPDGGWPSEAKYYRGTGDWRQGYELVGWGPIKADRMNEWVTADALGVLAAAGR